MNTAIQWLYSQHGGVLMPGPEHCYLCGIVTHTEHSVAKGIADTFNSHYLAKCPSSPWLCAACFWYFADKSHPDFRKMSLMVQRNSYQDWERRLMKPFITHWLATGLSDDAYLVCSLSKKKHILLQAPMNAKGSYQFAVQVEEQVAHLERDTWIYLDSRFMTLLTMGHNKGEILTGNLYGSTLRKHGCYADALQLSKELEPYRHSALLELLSYVTIIEERTADPDGNGIDNARGKAPESRLEPDRPGVQSEVPHGHLDTSRNERGGVRSHEQQPAEVSQQSLW